jgi:hypothetical protein
MPPQLAPPNGAISYSSPYAPKPPSSMPSQPSEQPPLAENRSPTQGPLPTAAPRQQPPQLQNLHQTHPPSNENTIRAIELFKTAMIKSLKATTSNAEEIVGSAVNRVMGVTSQSTVPGNSHEEKIMAALKNMLGQVNALPEKENQRPPQNQPNQNTTQNDAAPQPVKAPNPEKPAPTVMRPTFTGQGQNRPNGPSVPRPPMNTPGMNKNNSGSPANAPPRSSAPSSASPAPTPSSGSGDSTLKLPATENGQLAGQKRAHDDADDMREFKRLSTSGPPQLKT